jgi:hypothetical protein
MQENTREQTFTGADYAKLLEQSLMFPVLPPKANKLERSEKEKRRVVKWQ